jgi:hypothetical protein
MCVVSKPFPSMRQIATIFALRQALESGVLIGVPLITWLADGSFVED